MVETSRRRIAVLDDEPYICHFLSKILTEHGYAVMTAGDGQRGLELINREHPDLIILDLVMPGLSGYALLDILNAKESKTPVLVLSSVSNLSDNLAHQGIAGLLIKPIDERRLLLHVDSIFKLEEAARGMPTSVKEVWESEKRSPDDLTLPGEAPTPSAALSAAPAPEPKAADRTTAAAPKPVVLVVEDEGDMQMLLRGLLEHQGFEVLIAGNGIEGLDLAEKRLPNAIILDIMLPKMDGFQVCRLLKYNEKYSGIPIVILTARSMPADRELAEVSGADAYLVKPFETETLVKTLRRVMRI